MLKPSQNLFSPLMDLVRYLRCSIGYFEIEVAKCCKMKQVTAEAKNDQKAKQFMPLGKHHSSKSQQCSRMQCSLTLAAVTLMPAAATEAR